MLKRIIKIKNFKKPAFTMVEIIVVLMIISIGIVGIMSLVVQNVQTQSYDKDTLIATQLAQEGIELIRMVRDSNWKAGRSFDYSLSFGFFSFARPYHMSYLDSYPYHYTGNPKDLVLKKDSQGFYFNDSSSSASDTIFSRLITITKNSPHSLIVTVTITWKDHDRNYSYVLKTMLYDWK